MRRAALQSLRATSRLFFHRSSPFLRGLPSGSSHHAAGLHRVSTTSPPEQQIPRSVLTASMRLRSLSVAVASAVVGSGAWYMYRGASPSSGSAGVHTARGPVDANPRSGSRQSVLGGDEYLRNQLGNEDADENQDPRRRAVVIDNDAIYTGLLGGDGPLEKSTDDYGRKMLEMLTPEQATQKLRRNEESRLVGRGRGVVRYDVVQVPSNDPIEDDHSEKIIEVPQTVAATTDGSPSSDWMFWGVYDGHSGWTTSAKLRQLLIGFVARELNATYKSALADPFLTIPRPEAIDAAIKKGFIRLDHEIIHESVEKVIKADSKRVAAELLAPALSGSCALLSFYDSQSKTLRVACTGDSRAVLGRRNAHGKWTATPLSVDQTGGNEEEAARLRREHPGEPNVVRDGRILGQLEPSRAFGDSFYKWTRDVQLRIKGSFFGRTPSQLLQTPPYVTAEPIVTTTKVDPSQGDFVVMATDGLWEMLTNEQVVGLVGKWLEAQGEQHDQGGSSSSSSKTWLNSWFKTNRKSNPLPVEREGEDQTSSSSSNGKKNGRGQKKPVRQHQWGLVNGDEEDDDSRFVVEDKNAATHLVRNALGGQNRDVVCALLTLPSPYSRRYRDDLTVEVIFFGEGDHSGNVVLNPEASAGATQFKAKL
ncbi:MAG: hypothetical protein M1823_002789 [Watsoniomyces obsoletus]|nr:MAG: hypothetical protein M1823_002789 [Watsoniomyces obsoletus]